MNKENIIIVCLLVLFGLHAGHWTVAHTDTGSSPVGYGQESAVTKVSAEIADQVVDPTIDIPAAESVESEGGTENIENVVEALPAAPEPVDLDNSDIFVPPASPVFAPGEDPAAL